MESCRFNLDTSSKRGLRMRKNWLGLRINPVKQPHSTARVRSISDSQILRALRMKIQILHRRLYAMKNTRQAAHLVAGCALNNTMLLVPWPHSVFRLQSRPILYCDETLVLVTELPATPPLLNPPPRALPYSSLPRLSTSCTYSLSAFRAPRDIKKLSHAT